MAVESLTQFFVTLNSYLWGPPMLLLLVGTGVLLTFVLGGVQFRLLGHSLYLALIKRHEEGDAEGDISHFQALMTALAATVGTGNIAGVATAIAAGGPGALFWMWVTGLFGMATKYAEALLAVKYRVTDSHGRMSGGPMYYLANGLNSKFLGAAFAVLTALAAFGIGNMVQSNSVATAMDAAFGWPTWVSGVLMMVGTGVVILGGIHGIARVTQVLVPAMIVLYVAAAMIVVLLRLDQIPAVLSLVLSHAFSPTAAAGGFLGATLAQTMRYGVGRGVFSNESGLGSAAIAAAAAQTKLPVTQALVSMTQTFIDTIVVCSMTGFVILSTGAWSSGVTGAPLTVEAFNLGLPGDAGGIVVPLALVFFAYSTILGWSYYGEKSVEYLFGERLVVPYRALFTAMVFVGTIGRVDLIWEVADSLNAAMAIPNLIGLLGLALVCRRDTRAYFATLARKKFASPTY